MKRTLNIHDSAIIGAFATCTEKFALVSQGTSGKICKSIEDMLKVPVFPKLINGSTVVGSMCRGNSNGLLVPRNAIPEDFGDLDVPVYNLPGKLNAVGNVVLANDSTALAHPELSDRAIATIGEALKVEVYRGTIGGMSTVGMAAVATNKGLLVHPLVSKKELEFLEKIFDLPVNIGTSNFGTQMVGSGVIANSKGYVAGSKTTGHELAKIEDALDFID
jgi:translation initiation factor 6